MSDPEYCATPGLVCNEKGRKVDYMDGLYMLLEKKSSTGGRVLKKLPTKYFDDVRGWLPSVPVYLYWAANRNKWYFDDDTKTNNIMATSPRLADENSNTKRW